MGMDMMFAALIAGAVLAGLAASALEWRRGPGLRLAFPWIDPDRPLRAFLVCLLAGPAALLNEARLVSRSDPVLACGIALAALVWCLTSGIVTLEALNGIRLAAG